MGFFLQDRGVQHSTLQCNYPTQQGAKQLLTPNMLASITLKASSSSRGDHTSRGQLQPNLSLCTRHHRIASPHSRLSTQPCCCCCFYATATLSASFIFLGPLPALHLAMNEGMYLAVDSLTQGEPRKLEVPHQAHASVSVPCNRLSRQGKRRGRHR